MPVPSWLLENPIKRTARKNTLDKNIKLFYPAAGYPHKNHKILALLDDYHTLPVDECVLTVPESDNPAPKIGWLKCLGLMSPADVMKMYSKIDAMIFLSLKESYGFPLVEAMVVGLPILCPNLPYSRHLCGDQAVYFEATNPRSLSSAIYELTARLRAGWWPNWNDRLEDLPKTWSHVAEKIIKVTLQHK
jgi:glycosyltransferase involved in cell wall biosynthesis